jgi:hypothetical protein
MWLKQIMIGLLFLSRDGVMVAQERTLLVRLDGQKGEGTLTGLDAKGAIVRIDQQDVTIPSDQIQSIRMVGTVAPFPADLMSVELGLVDGSRIRAKDFQGEGQQWRVWAVDAQGKALDPLPVPDSNIKWVRFRGLTPNEVSAWQGMLDEEATSDVLVISRDAGLDRLQGVIQSIGEQRVRFDFDGQPLDAARSKFLGAVWLRKPIDRIQPVARVLLRDGSVWMATQVAMTKPAVPATPGRSSGTAIQWTTPLGLAWSCAMTDLLEIDYSMANLRWLAELPVLERKLVVGMGPDRTAAMRDNLFAPRMVSSTGSTSFADQDLFFSVPGEITYRVPEGFRRFRCRVQRSSTNDFRGQLQLEVWLGDQLAWSGKLETDDLESTIEVDVQPEMRLRLVVRSPQGMAVGTNVHWIQPRLQR